MRSGLGVIDKYAYDHIAPWRGYVNEFYGGGLTSRMKDVATGAGLVPGTAGAPTTGGAAGAAPSAANPAGTPVAASAPAPGVPLQTMQDGLAAGQAAAGATRGDRAAAVMRFFTGEGWNRVQAAGPTANVGAESGYNPFAVGDHGHAYGLGQWQGPRQAEYAKLFGHTMQSVKDFVQAFSEQLEFYQHELTRGTDAGARKAGRLLGQSTTGYDSGSIVSMFDERPFARDEEARNRGSAAELLAQNDGASGGKVQVDTRIRITRDGRVETASSAKGDGSARASRPKVETAMVFA